MMEKLSLFKGFLSWKLCHVKAGAECLGLCQVGRTDLALAETEGVRE